MSAQRKTTNCTLPRPQGALDTKTRATAQAWGNKRHFYKPLPKEFRRDGFTYTQIAREGGVAIYERCWIGFADPSVCYEVIRIRRRESFQIEGRLIEASEIYPRPEDWGATGGRCSAVTLPLTSCERFACDRSRLNSS